MSCPGRYISLCSNFINFAVNVLPAIFLRLIIKELRGIIKGSGYLCGCQPCNYSKASYSLYFFIHIAFFACVLILQLYTHLKVLNAYEFERHAGCKTKHPNNHIYFENGKTIYQITQELRSTPQSLLFDAIQTVTGSPINQKAFRIWKGSCIQINSLSLSLCV